MEPNLSNQQTPQPAVPKSQKDDQYAEALAKMATLDYQMEQKAQPPTKHFIPKKMVIYLAVSLVISIIMLIVGHFVTRNQSQEKSDQTINQLLETTKDVRDLENQ